MKVSKMFMVVCLSLHTCQCGDLSIAQCTLAADSSWKIFLKKKHFLSVPRLVTLQKKKKIYASMVAVVK